MTRILWDQIGERQYETGVDHGVLYRISNLGVYDTGYAWNGLTTVTESPSGAESNPQYADNIKYVDILSAEQFGATIEALMYPVQFEECDGSARVNGVSVGQQGRKPFGLSYRTLKGNDTQGTAYGYKLHLVYGATAAPSEKANTTVNDSPEAITFSWELSTTPVPVGTINGVEWKPTATLTIDSTTVDADDLAALELILYGSPGVDPRLPLPSEVLALFAAGALTPVNLNLAANTPTFVSGTGVITLPTVTGIQWKVNGVNKAPGAQPALSTGESATVTGHPTAGYTLAAGSDDDWSFTRP